MIIRERWPDVKRLIDSANDTSKVHGSFCSSLKVCLGVNICFK